MLAQVKTLVFVRKKHWTKSCLPVLYSPEKRWVATPSDGYRSGQYCSGFLHRKYKFLWNMVAAVSEAIITLTSSLLLAAKQTVQLMRVVPAVYEAFQSVSFLLKTAEPRQLYKQVIQTVIQLTLPSRLLVFMIAVQCRSSMSENVPFSKTWKNIQRKEFYVSTLQPEWRVVVKQREMWNVLPTTALQTKSASVKKLSWGYDCILFWRQIHVVSAICLYSPEAKIFIMGGAFQFRAISEETTCETGWCVI